MISVDKQNNNIVLKTISDLSKNNVCLFYILISVIVMRVYPIYSCAETTNPKRNLYNYHKYNFSK